MNLATSSSCSLCGLHKETMVHLFCKCSKTIELWRKLAEKLNLDLPTLTPESAFFGFFRIKNILYGHIHLVFKIEIFKNRKSGTISVSHIINKIKQIKRIERLITASNENAKRKNYLKWSEFTQTEN